MTPGYRTLRGLTDAFRRRLLFAGFTVGFALLAMVISFALVRWLTLGVPHAPPVDPAVQQRAILLRGFANDITLACNDYVHIVVQADGRVKPDARTWIDRVFRRDIRFLDQRLEGYPMTTVPAWLELRAAVRRCDSMARNPDDNVLRHATLQDVGRAVDAVEQYIQAVAMARSAGPAPVRRSF